jgi:hypothetical protein
VSTFPARFYGACAADCGDRIKPDDEVQYVADELMHAECAGQIAARPPARVQIVKPCPTCWTVHAGECM